MISGLSDPRLRWFVLAVAVSVVLFGSLACSTQSANIGKYYKGRILHVSIAAMERTDELRWTPSSRSARASDPDDMFYRLAPLSEEYELVLLRVKVENHTATSAVVNVDEQSAQLRDFLRGRYFPVDVSARAEEVGVPENPADRCSFPVNPESPNVCVRFLWNQTFEEVQPNGEVGLVQRSQELIKGHGLDGWMIFEVPKGLELRSFRWAAGDTVTIDF